MDALKNAIYASDDWASETGYYLATGFHDTQDGRMQQADDIASSLTTLRDYLLQRIAELEAQLEAEQDEVRHLMIYGVSQP